MARTVRARRCRVVGETWMGRVLMRRPRAPAELAAHSGAVAAQRPRSRFLHALRPDPPPLPPRALTAAATTKDSRARCSGAALPQNVIIQLCGRFAIDVDGVPREASLPGRQARLLVACLALHHPHPLTRERLIEALWGDAAPRAQAQALAVLLSKTRRVLGADVLTTGDATVRLSPQVEIDFHAAERGLAEIHAAVGHARWSAVIAAARDIVALHD